MHHNLHGLIHHSFTQREMKSFESLRRAWLGTQHLSMHFKEGLAAKLENASYAFKHDGVHLFCAHEVIEYFTACCCVNLQLHTKL